MIYAVADIHGCAWEFDELLKKIHFSNDDLLYVVGDTVDRGPNPIGVLRTMALYPNIIPILGNHEYMLLKCLPGLLKEIREDNVEETLTKDFMEWTSTWMYNGGDITANAFKRLSREDQEFYLDYISEFSDYESVNLNGQQYILIHSLPQVAPYMDWRKCSMETILFGRPDFYAEWPEDVIYITGHTPTFSIHEDYRGKYYRNGGLIDIDCGSTFDGTLCAYCLDTGEAFYV